MSDFVTAFVPLKGHSSRVPGKNLRDFHGRPLFHVILETLLEADTVAGVYIDTDDDEIAASAASLEVLMLVNVYEPLLWYNAPGSAEQFTPALATSWSVSDDGLSWTFNLRKNVKFHDGEAFNAAAAKASLDRTIKLGKGLAYIWGNVDSVTAAGKHTLVIKTKNPQPVDLIASSQYAAICILPKQLNQGLTGLTPETQLELALIQFVNGIKRNK